MTTPDPTEPAALPPVDELLARLHVVSLPLVTRFRGVTHREIALLDGPAGWSEFSPFLEYDDAEAATWLAGALEGAFDATLPRVRDGVVHVNATVPAVPAERVPEVLARFDGCRTAKVKVAEPGHSLADDVARVGAVRDAMGADARVRVDANAGWDLDAAERAITALAAFDLEYAEQPVPGIDGLAELRRRLRARGVAVRIAADEAVRKASDPLAVARAGAADLIVVKAQPLGGVRRAAAVVREAGLPATVSSALDSSVGIALGAQLAAAIAVDTERAGGPPGGFDAGLGTVSLFAADVVREPLVPRGGVIPLAAAIPDPELLAEHAAPRDRIEWWHERVRRCHAVLAGDLGE